MRTRHLWAAALSTALVAGAMVLPGTAAGAAPLASASPATALHGSSGGSTGPSGHGLPPKPTPRPSHGQTSPSPTPYQGWNTYFGLGGDYDATEVLGVADFLVSSGLAASGYDIVWLDGGWQADVPRGDDGELQGDPERFPDGMAALAAAIHAKGLRAGIYTDAGPYIPGTCGLGSYGHYQTDADTIAAWGYDAVKVDFLCGIAADLDPKTVYTQFAQALRHNSSGRSIIFNLCNPVTSPDWGDYPEEQQSTSSWTYAPAIAESWRTYTDVGFVGQIQFRDVLRNYDANARHPEVAGPGHFNDPDYLGPGLGMTDEEFRTQMTLWSVAAAPLVIGSDPRALSSEALDILRDEDVLAIDQDRLGLQATRVGPAGATETWVKPLSDGSVAVALLNRGDSPAEVSTTAAAVGLSGASFRVLDAWDDTVTGSAGAVRAAVPAHGAALLRVTPAHPAPGVPRLVATTPVVAAVDGTFLTPSTDALAAAGDQLQVAVTLHNDGTKAVAHPQVTLTVPDGWSTAADEGMPHAIPPRGSATVSFTVGIPTAAATGGYGISAAASFTPGGRHGQAVVVTAPAARVTVAPQPPAGAGAPLSHHPWVSATSGWLQPAIDESVGGGNPLTVGGAVYATGLGVASPSDIRYYLGAACTRLTGAVGIDDVVDNVGPEGGTATFAVIGDGITLWSTDTVGRGVAVPFGVDLSGVRDLVLRVGDAGDGGYNDRADWLAPAVDCQTTPPAPPAGTGVVLSHHPWVSATSGWLQPAIDESVGGGNPLTVGGAVYATGLGVASPSDIRYYLGAGCTRLAGAVGIDDVVDNVGPEGGTATFAVVGDGVTLWSSGIVARGGAVPVEADVSGVQYLELQVGDAGDGGYNDRADWLSPTVDCG